MPCTSCDDEIRSEPPYANLADTELLYDKVCATCTATVAGGTATVDFCSTGFGGTPDECCDILYVYEGLNLWVSEDCTNWFLISGGVAQTLFYEETKTDSLESVFDITGVPSGFDEILIKAQFTAASFSNIWNILEVNNDSSAANYDGGGYSITDAGTVTGISSNITCGFMTDIVSNPLYFFDYEIKIQKYADSTYYKTIKSVFNGKINTIFYTGSTTQTWKSTTDISSIQIYSATATPAKSGFYGIDSWVRAWVL